MYECMKDDCHCMVDYQFTYFSEECENDLACGHEGCACGSKTNT